MNADDRDDRPPAGTIIHLMPRKVIDFSQLSGGHRVLETKAIDVSDWPWMRWPRQPRKRSSHVTKTNRSRKD